jgi:hypothetical protein
MAEKIKSPLKKGHIRGMEYVFSAIFTHNRTKRAAPSEGNRFCHF